MGAAKIALFCTLVLSACAGPRMYGYFLERASTQASSELAEEIAAQLCRAYSPAHLALALPDATDAFGNALVARLRRAGFAVADAGTKAPPQAAIVHYVVDSLGEPLVRVTLVVVRQRDRALLSRMSRAYALSKSGGVRAAGAWTRQKPAEEAAWTTN
jgi:Conjugal transfer protein TrbH